MCVCVQYLQFIAKAISGHFTGRKAQQILNPAAVFSVMLPSVCVPSFFSDTDRRDSSSPKLIQNGSTILV